VIRRSGGLVAPPGGSSLPFSLGIEHAGLIYLSGQVALVDGKLCGDGIEQQTRIVLENIAALLKLAELTLDDVIKVNVWLTHKEDFAGFNAAYADHLRAPYPVRSTVISKLVVEGALIEIEAMAARGAQLQA
jgi:2-iminobutanoate/2-iminopropanoate deaminase